MRENTVAIYCRLSKEDLDKDESNKESESIKNQKSMLTEYAERKNWIIYDYYIDEDYSGSDRYRPEFNRLITDSLLGCFGIVLCKKQARFARDIEYIERYIHGVFAENGIRFVSLLDNIDTGLPTRTYSKASRINSLIDEWYLEDLSENTSSALTVKRRNGEFIGSFAPYGYVKDPSDKNHLIIDPIAASIVKRIFRMYASGYGISCIAQTLNEEGIPNPKSYKQQAGLFINDNNTPLYKGLWKASTISYLLKNRTYLGYLVQGKLKKASYKSKKLIRLPKEQWIIVGNCHEAIIDNDTWNQVQHIMKTSSRVRGERKKHYCLAGMIYCGECGGKLISSGGRSGKRKVNYLTCSARLKCRDACIGTRIELMKLTDIILERIKFLLYQYYDEDYLLNGIKNALFNIEKPAEQKLNQQIIKLEHDIKRKEKQIETAYFDKLNGIIDSMEFTSIKKKLLNDQKILKTALEEGYSEIQKIDKIKNSDIKCYVQRFRNPPEVGREMAALLIDSVYIYHRQTDGSQKIIINWNI